MKSFGSILALSGAASAAAIMPRQDSTSHCCFDINVAGTVAGPLGQLADGQNRVGPGFSSTQFCYYNGTDSIVDSTGRGCIVTAPTSQYQCDAGLTATTATSGITIANNGSIEHNGSAVWYECNSGSGYNIYANSPGSAAAQCSQIMLNIANGNCSAPVAPSSSAPASSAPASSASSKPATSPSAPASSPSAPASSSVPITSATTIKVTETTAATTTLSPSTASTTVVSTAAASTCIPTTVVSTAPASTIVNTATVTVTAPGTTDVTTAPASSCIANTVTALANTVTVTAPGPTDVITAPAATCVPTTVVSTAPAATVTAPAITVTSTATAPASTVTVTESVIPSPHVAPSSAQKSTITSSVFVTSSVTAVSTAPVSTAPVSAPAPPPASPVAPSSKPAPPVPTVASSTAPASPSAPAASSCPAGLGSNYEYPHLIVPVSSSHPDTAYGTQYFAGVNSTFSTIFNFDILPSSAGKTCTLEFLLPQVNDLPTSSYTHTGTGAISFEQLAAPATQSTTFANQPAVAMDLGSFNVTRGSSTIVASGPCAAGMTVSYELVAEGNTELYYFQDWNAPAIGLYIVEC